MKKLFAIVLCAAASTWAVGPKIPYTFTFTPSPSPGVTGFETQQATGN